MRSSITPFEAVDILFVYKPAVQFWSFMCVQRGNAKYIVKIHIRSYGHWLSIIANFKQTGIICGIKVV